MIQGKVQALFELIEFLHSNIDNFKKYETTIQQYLAIIEERSKLKPDDFYKDKIAYEKNTTQMKELHTEIVKNITDKIHDKIIELNLLHESKRHAIDEYSHEIHNCSIGEIWELKKNFNVEDVPVIISFKSKYQQFRKETNERVYFTQILFHYLDETLYELFNFFEEPKPTESLNQETAVLPPPTQREESITPPSPTITKHRSIVFVDFDKTTAIIFDAIKGFFNENDYENLKKALSGEDLEKPIAYLGSTKAFAELFKRVRYHGFLRGNNSQITGWICKNFTYRNNDVQKAFNKETVMDVLRNSSKEPAKNSRIKIEAFPYLNPSERNKSDE